MDWQHVIERIAVNAGYIVTIFTAIKYFVLNPLENDVEKKKIQELRNRTHFKSVSCRKHQKIKSHL